MAVVQTIDDLSTKAGEFDDKDKAAIYSVTLCRYTRELIVTGIGWMKKMAIRLR